MGSMSAELLFAAVRQAINDADGAAATPDDLLTLQATAAVGVVARLGFFETAGDEYAVKRGDVTIEVGFNTEDQARDFAARYVAAGFTIHRRPVGVWEQVG